MKIRLNDKPAGVVLLVALLVIVVAGIVLASYLKLMQSENKSVARSQIWNRCVPVMEAGVEVAMAQIESCGNSTNLSTNGWVLTPVGTNNYYQKTNTVGTNGSYFVASILPVLPPVIYSTGCVAIPGTSTNYISRKVRVATQFQQSGGFYAKGNISVTRATTFDSYNSSIGAYGAVVGGVTNISTNAVVLTDSTNAGAISLGNNNTIINGIAVTGPGGSVTGGTVTGGTFNDANVQINDVSPPSGYTNWNTSFVPGSMCSTCTNYSIFLSSGNFYYNGTVNLSSGSAAIGVFGNVQLYISGDLVLSSQTSIYVDPGASLTIYIAGNVNLSGGSVMNSLQLPPNLTLYGLPTCTSFSMGGNASFYGKVYAPEATFSLGGTGGFFGSATANTISDTGTGGIHFDQALAKGQPFIAASWNEF